MSDVPSEITNKISKLFKISITEWVVHLIQMDVFIWILYSLKRRGNICCLAFCNISTFGPDYFVALAILRPNAFFP